MNVYPKRKTHSLLRLPKVARRPDVEGTPCGIAVLKKGLKALDSVFWRYFLTRSGTRYRCPLHIPPLRRGPSPAGEGFWGFRPEVIRIRPGFQIPPVCTAPHQSGLCPASFPKGEAFGRNFQLLHISAVLGAAIFRPLPDGFIYSLLRLPALVLVEA